MSDFNSAKEISAEGYTRGGANIIVDLQAEIAKRDYCPWCTSVINQHGVGGMAPFDLGGTMWHQGCVADLDRSTREVPE